MSTGDDLRALGEHLQTRSFGRVHEHYEQIGSTNDRALQWARQGAPHGAVVTAESQTGGRGRRGRIWVSPGGQLYASVIVRPQQTGPTIGALGLAVAVGLREGLEVPSIQLKWPNDLLVGGRKLAGILCEARWQDDAPELVIGFGINVRTFQAPAEIADIATTLEDAGATELGRASVLAGVLGSLEPVLELFLARGFASIRHRYEPHSAVLGQRVQLDDASGRRTVLADAFDEDGALLVRARPGAVVERVEAADVWLTR